MVLMHDFLLVEEVQNNDTIEGTNLKILQDDLSQFMHVRIIDHSIELLQEYIKYYPHLTIAEASQIIRTYYKKGNKLLINRVAKKTTDDGYYVISFKDVLAIEEDINNKTIENNINTEKEILIRG